MKSQVTFIYTVYHTIQIFRAVFKKKKKIYLGWLLFIWSQWFSCNVKIINY